MRLLTTLAFVLIFLGTSYAQPSKWQWASPTPQGNNITKMAIADSESVFFCGALSTISHLNTKDESWSIIAQASNLTSNLTDIAFLHKSRGITVGTNDLILSGYYFSKDTGVVVGLYDILYSPSNYGTTWYPLLDTSWNPPVDTTTTESVAQSTLAATIYAIPNPSHGEFRIDGNYKQIFLFGLLGNKLDHSIRKTESSTIIKVNQDYSGVVYCRVRTWDNQLKVFSLVLY